MDLTALSLADASRMLHAREISSRELTEFFLARIAQLNPTLNAFITITADAARAQARKADAELERGFSRGPLHGIPLALKDLFDVQGLPTTAGSKILHDQIAAEDATVTTRLRAAGAVLLGKQNLHEWAFGVTNNNSHFGPVPNPWDQDRIPGGSSGGTAASVSARLCLGGIGSDTGGSIRIPASLCGVTGIKPTYGRVSLRGVVPLSWSNDHAGPLAQTVEDAALILQAIAGYDPFDPVSVNVSVSNFTLGLERSLEGVRIAVPGGFFAAQVDEPILAAVRGAVKVLESCGASLIERDLEFAEDLYLANRKTLPPEAAAYHRDNMERRPEDYGSDVLTRLRNGAAIPAHEYAWARRRQAELTRRLENFLNDVDLIAVPTTRIVAPHRDVDATVMAQHLTAFTAPFNTAGVPAISIPCGFTNEGLPIGLQLVTRHWNEALVLQAAHQYQLRTDWHTRRPPF